jgi:hypothetical protein
MVHGCSVSTAFPTSALYLVEVVCLNMCTSQRGTSEMRVTKYWLLLSGIVVRTTQYAVVHL